AFASKPSRGDLYSRVGGAGSAPPHDRGPARWVMQALLDRVAAILLSAVTPAKEKSHFQQLKVGFLRDEIP
ncbi:MAG: hypothetical protein IKL25_10190, partial [Clostridia bacterium]|nr:hypothetical protein [Clostridia bacterium]